MKWNYKTYGIPDELFLRGKVPMTKAEVRSVTISKLKLKSDSVVVDVGAGTGSIAIEAAHICRDGKVFAIERNQEAVELIKINCEAFEVNITILHGQGAEELRKILSFDRVIIGGSGGELDEIISICYEKLAAGGICVVNSVTIETLYKANEMLRKIGFKNIEVVSMSVARGKNSGNYTLMEALNPVYIISGYKE
ncbi:MAG: precorrin-6Y C5,15-methyltransferase (decarboxylating) subunit CbiT [Alkaliphilus sp.]|nr:precorrin-6Y C5,15-methyltransferase (decarboxylating) subunit CbiT [Alkaliphilus sp.]